MIELYRTDPESDPAGSGLPDRVEATMRDLVVGHRVHVVARPDDAPGGSVPVVRDGDRLVAAGEIPAYLDELRRFMTDWRRFQADACYIGDDGSAC